jgi:Putative auto-transporter adhesin, head GIN domain
MVLAMRIIAIAAAIIAAAPASAAERRYTVTDFDRIKVEGPFQVTLSTGRSSAAVATGSPRAIDQLSVEVQSRTLRIGRNPNAWGGYPGESPGPVKIEVSTHSLREATVQGAGSVTVDKAKAMRFQASVSGSGKVGVGQVEADTVALSLMGSGRIEMGGKTKALRASIHGAGDLAASGLKAEDAVIGAGTSGTIAVAVMRSAKVTATGAGDIEIIGDPACTVEARGAGQVSCGKN